MLLDARKTPALERAFAAYGRHLLRRDFARLWLGGVSFPSGTAPSIALVNHSAWWDPLLAVHLSHDLFRRDGYGLMLSDGLKRYPFFRRVGCFGASTDSLDDVRAVSTYAAALLRGGRSRTLWLFPQGTLASARAPLAFRSGAARIARVVDEATIIPVAVRYELRAEQRPEIFVRVGPAVAREELGVGGEAAGTATRRLERALRHELAQLDADLARPALPDDYRAAWQGARSLSGLYDRTFGRWARPTAPGDGDDDRPNARQAR